MELKDFFSKLQNGQIIKPLPNYLPDGTHGDDIVTAHGLWVKDSNGSGKLFYDSISNPVLNIKSIKNKFGKYITNRYYSYALVNYEYKIISYGEVINRFFKKLNINNEIIFNLDDLALEIVCDPKRRIPDYSNSKFVNLDLDNFLMGQLKHIIIDKNLLKDYMIRMRPITIEEVINKEPIINSVECYKFLCEDNDVKKDIIPLFRKNRIDRLFDDE